MGNPYQFYLALTCAGHLYLPARDCQLLTHEAQEPIAARLTSHCEAILVDHLLQTSTPCWVRLAPPNGG